MGWETSRLGYPTGAEICGLRNGGCLQDFQSGAIYWSPATGAQPVLGAIRTKWAATQWETGPLGYPLAAETCGLADEGCYQRFQGRSIYWSKASGAHVVRPSGAVRAWWVAAGKEAGRLGYPTGDETCGLPDTGCVQHFQDGQRVRPRRVGVVVVTGAIAASVASTRTPSPARLGSPITARTCGLSGGGCYPALPWRRDLLVGGERGARHRGDRCHPHPWVATGKERGRLGYPVGDQTCGLPDGGCSQHFQGGSLSSSTRGTSSSRASSTPGGSTRMPRPAAWAPDRGPTCGLTGAGCYQPFRSGAIVLVGFTGAHVVMTAVPSGPHGSHSERKGATSGTRPATRSCGLIRGGCFQEFQRAHVYWSPATGARVVSGKIFDPGPPRAGSGVRWATRRTRPPFLDHHPAVPGRDARAEPQHRHGHPQVGRPGPRERPEGSFPPAAPPFVEKVGCAVMTTAGTGPGSPVTVDSPAAPRPGATAVPSGDPSTGRSRRWRPAAWVLAGLTLVLAVALPLAPVSVDTPEVQWPLDPADPQPTTALFMPYRPIDITATAPCATVREFAGRQADGASAVLLATALPSSTRGNERALSITVGRDAVRVVSSGAELWQGPVPAGRTARWSSGPIRTAPGPPSRPRVTAPRCWPRTGGPRSPRSPRSPPTSPRPTVPRRPSSPTPTPGSRPPPPPASSCSSPCTCSRCSPACGCCGGPVRVPPVAATGRWPPTGPNGRRWPTSACRGAAPWPCSPTSAWSSPSSPGRRSGSSTPTTTTTASRRGRWTARASSGTSSGSSTCPRCPSSCSRRCWRR